MTTPSSSHRHLCLDLSPAAIRDHFAFVGDSSIVEALSDEDLVAAAEAWLDEGSDEPWASYDRFCRAICVRAREAAVAQGRMSPSVNQQPPPGQRQWVAVGERECAVVATRHGATWELFYTACGRVEELPGLGNEYEAGAIVAAVARRHRALEHAQQGCAP